MFQLKVNLKLIKLNLNVVCHGLITYAHPHTHKHTHRNGIIWRLFSATILLFFFFSHFPFCVPLRWRNDECHSNSQTINLNATMRKSEKENAEKIKIKKWNWNISINGFGLFINYWIKVNWQRIRKCHCFSWMYDGCVCHCKNNDDGNGFGFFSVSISCSSFVRFLYFIIV